ncbi:hypothetical protein [Endozoicomonas sp. 8E]|uniref:hypothetical protein n=1 Tax=Endozoicomonas sp. 8E TaxID=3035692 RepID=UPI0029392E53|nr:hypothetical protein [Endozoicomonas sp. 8E]WOG27107.1 hypothetical protein P6910_21530 [Endozoicomonas sp. 8E]
MIKHIFFSAVLLLILSLSVVCQDEPLTRHFFVELGQDSGSLKKNFSIKPGRPALPDNPSDIPDTSGCAGPGSSPDNKSHKQNSYEIKTTLVEPISWQLLRATRLLVAYELTLITKDVPLCSTPYSWLPAEVVIIVGWLLKSYWNADFPLFSPAEQKAASLLTQEAPPFASITVMFGSDHNQQQYQSSKSSGQQAPQTPSHSKASFISQLNNDYGGNRGPQQHSHTLELNCYVSPCHGVCQLQPSTDSREPAEWSLNSVSSSCPHLVIGHCLNCVSCFDPLYTTDSQEKLSLGSSNDLSDVRLPFDCDRLFDDNFIDGVASDGVADTTGAADSLNDDAPVLASFPTITNGFAVIKKASDLQPPIQEDGCFITLEHSEKQPRSSRLDQNLPHLSRTVSNQAAAHSGQKACNATVIGKDDQPRPCGKVCKNAQVLSLHRRMYHSGQKTCHTIVAGKDGQQRPCGKICKNLTSLHNHKSNAHSAQKTCDVIVVEEGSQTRPCGTVCKNPKTLSNHKRSCHSGEKTCDVTFVSEDGEQRPCGMICKNAATLSIHRTNAHSRQKTCDATVVGEDGQPQSCGTVCKSAKSFSDHKRNFHSGRKTCDVKIVGEDGQPQPCGMVCKNFLTLTNHRRDVHSGQQTCDAIVIGEDGQPRPCGLICRNTQILSYHKSLEHTGQQICEVTIVGEGGQQQPCGKACKNAHALSSHKSKYHTRPKAFGAIVVRNNDRHRLRGRVRRPAENLSDHKRRHRKRKPVNVDRDDD